MCFHAIFTNSHLTYSILQERCCSVTPQMLPTVLLNSTIILIANRVHIFVNMLRAFVVTLVLTSRENVPLTFSVNVNRALVILRHELHLLLKYAALLFIQAAHECIEFEQIIPV